MMKNIISSLMFLFIGIISAQKSDCATTQRELESAKIEVAELSKQNIYYKETLNLLKPISTDIVDDVEFSITKIIGSKKDKTITITFLYENKSFEIRDFLQCQEASAIDARGNQFQTYEVYVAPNKNIRAEKIKSNIPIKGNFVFKTDETNFPIFRILKILVYPKDNMSSPKEVIFENVAVVWE